MILEDILTQSGVEYALQRGNLDEVIMSCPFCVGSTDQVGQRKVFGMNLSDGKAHCHRCGWKSRSVVFTARELCRVWNIDFTWRLRLSAAEAQEEIAEKPQKKRVKAVACGLPEGYESFGDLTDDIERIAFDYLRARRITRKDIDEYRIGFAGAGEFAWRILFPVFGEDGDVFGCAGRDFSGKSLLKYKNTQGIKLLFNGQRHADVAVVVEGPVDVLAVERTLKFAGWPATVAVGALGSAVTAEQIAQLMKYKKVIHFPDNDLAGLKGAMRRADATTEAGIDTWITAPQALNGSDPGNMTGAEILASVKNARRWTRMEKMRMRLRAIQ